MYTTTQQKYFADRHTHDAPEPLPRFTVRASTPVPQISNRGIPSKIPFAAGGSSSIFGNTSNAPVFNNSLGNVPPAPPSYFFKTPLAATTAGGMFSPPLNSRGVSSSTAKEEPVLSAREKSEKSSTPSWTTEIPSQLRSLANQMELDVTQFISHAEYNREQLEKRANTLALENAQLQQATKQEDNRVEELTKKSEKLQNQRDKAELLNQELQLSVHRLQKELSVEKGKHRIGPTELLQENKELRDLIANQQHHLEHYDSTLKSIESYMSSLSFSAHSPNGYASAEGGGEDSTEKSTKLSNSRAVTESTESELVKQLRLLVTSTPPPKREKIKTAEELMHHTVLPLGTTEAILIQEIVGYLRAMCEGLQSGNMAFINVKMDQSRLTKELRRNLEKFPSMVNRPPVTNALERLIVAEAAVMERLLKTQNSGGESGNAESNWNSVFQVVEDASSPKNATVVDIPYIVAILSHGSLKTLFNLLNVALSFANRHWFHLAKDALFSKLLTGQFEGCSGELVSSSICKLLRRNNGSKDALDVLKFVYAFSGIPSKLQDEETGNTLWHFAVKENNRAMITFLSGLDEFPFGLDVKNKQGLKPVELCDKNLREQFLTTIVVQYANDASDLYRRGLYSEACECYEKAIPHQTMAVEISSGPTNRNPVENLAKLHYNKARALAHLNRWLDAVQSCEQCISLLVSYHNAYTTAIAMYEKLLDWNAAFSICQRLHENCGIRLAEKMAELRSQINATKFQILEIPPTSGSPEIKQAFNRLCRVWHPDKAIDRKDPNLKRRHENHFNRLLEAKEFLLLESNRFMEGIRRETAYISPKYENGGMPSPGEYSSGSGMTSPSMGTTSSPQRDTVGGEAPSSMPSSSSSKTRTAAGGGRSTTEGDTKGDDGNLFKETKTSFNGTPEEEEEEESTSIKRNGETKSFYNASTAGSRNERDHSETEFESMSLEQLINHQQAITRSLDSLKMQQTEKKEELAGLEDRARGKPLDNLPSACSLTQRNVLKKELKALEGKIEKKEFILNALAKAVNFKTEEASFTHAESQPVPIPSPPLNASSPSTASLSSTSSLSSTTSPLPTTSLSSTASSLHTTSSSITSSLPATSSLPSISSSSITSPPSTTLRLHTTFSSSATSSLPTTAPSFPKMSTNLPFTDSYSDPASAVGDTFVNGSEDDVRSQTASSVTSSKNSAERGKASTQSTADFHPECHLDEEEVEKNISDSLQVDNAVKQWDAEEEIKPTNDFSSKSSFPSWLNSSALRSSSLSPEEGSGNLSYAAEELNSTSSGPQSDSFSFFEGAQASEKVVETPMHYSLHVVTDTTSATTAPPPPLPLFSEEPPLSSSPEKEVCACPPSVTLQTPDTIFLSTLLEPSVGHRVEARHRNPYAVRPKGKKEGDPSLPRRHSASVSSSSPVRLSSPLANGRSSLPPLISPAAKSQNPEFSSTNAKYSSPLISSRYRGQKGTAMFSRSEATSLAQRQTSLEQNAFYDAESVSSDADISPPPSSQSSNRLTAKAADFRKPFTSSKLTHSSSNSSLYRAATPLKRPPVMFRRQSLQGTQEGQRLKSKRLLFPDEATPKTIILPTASASSPTSRLTSVDDLFAHSPPYENGGVSEDDFSEEGEDTEQSDSRRFVLFGEQSEDDI